MYIVLSSILAIVMATLAIFIRMKAAKKPATVKKIILPPVFMSTGALMFFVPMFQVTLSQVLEALSVGALFSIVLIKTSKFEIKEGQIYLKRSKAFMFILFGLLIFRIILKTILGHYIPFGETSGMFFLLAFGMIVPWRAAMYISYRKMEKQLHAEQTNEKNLVKTH
ncbi:cytochrome c biogenesis protein CcdC [Bacillus tianshenii]|nr:cytochrome c biogenesis protein CcdC [Bacillus tianshenii]